MGHHAALHQRNGAHVACGLPPAATCTQSKRPGLDGVRRSWRPACDGVLPPLRVLHRRHAATTFSHRWVPPWTFGMTWSTFSADSPQYWHRYLSRRKIARRDSGTLRAWGTRTYLRSRTTEGTSMIALPACHVSPRSATVSAVPRRTRTTPRRAGTTESGSLLAFNTSVLATARIVAIPMGTRAGRTTLPGPAMAPGSGRGPTTEGR